MRIAMIGIKAIPARFGGCESAVDELSRGLVKLGPEAGNARPVRLPGYSGIWPDHAPWREYYIARNVTYAMWWLYPTLRVKCFTVRHLSRHACGAALFGSKKMACLQTTA